MFSLAHLSDLHATPVRVQRASELLNKRLLGWLSWRLKGHRIYRPEVLDSLVDDLKVTAPDHVVVTGDLTTISCEGEFPAAREWLQRLGGAKHVSVVPGNRDVYVRTPGVATLERWSEFMRSDPAPAPDAAGLDEPEGLERAEAPGAPASGFPAIRVRGPVALIGVCSAAPTAPFLAGGRVGDAQLERLERELAALAASSLCRVVLIHHPPVPGAVPPRRALGDLDRLLALLRRWGADLVLHGHVHRTSIARVPGPRGAIPVVGVRSGSDARALPHRCAQYHVYDIEPGGPERRFRIALRARGYDPGTGRFGAAGEVVL